MFIDSINKHIDYLNCRTSYVKSRTKTEIIVKFEIKIDIISYPLTPSWN